MADNRYPPRAGGEWRPSSPTRLQSLDPVRLGSSSSSSTETSSSEHPGPYYAASRLDDGSSGTTSTSALPVSPAFGQTQPTRSTSMYSAGFGHSHDQPLATTKPLSQDPYPQASQSPDWYRASRASPGASLDRRAQQSPVSSSAGSQSTAHISTQRYAPGATSPTVSISRSDGQAETEKRRRIQQACKSCSSRRVKCDGQKPCQTCIKNGDECAYGQPKKRGPPKGTTRLSRRSAQSGAASEQDRSRINVDNQRGRPRRDSRAEGMPWGSISRDAYVGARYDASPLPDVRSSGAFAQRLALFDDRQTNRYDHHGRTQERHQMMGRETADALTTSLRPPFGSPVREWQLHQLPPSPSQAADHSAFTGGFGHLRPLQRAPTNSGRPHLVLDARSSASDTRKRAFDWEQSISSMASNRLHGHDAGPESHDVTDFTLARLRLSNSGIDDTRYVPKRALAPLKEAPRASLVVPHIPAEIITNLFEEYWSTVHLYWPLFPRAAFANAKALLVHAETRAPLLYNAICCVAAANSGATTSTLSAQQLSDIFYSRAYHYHLEEMLSPSLESTSALLLLSSRDTEAGRASSANHFICLACRMIMDLHIQAPQHMSQSRGSAWMPREEEWRRRVYWAAYTNDKRISMQFGRPAMLRDLDAACPLPTCAEEEERDFESQLERPSKFYGRDDRDRPIPQTPIRLSAHLRRGCHLAHICEGIVALHTTQRGKKDASSHPSNAVRQVDSLSKQLEEWTEDIPESMRWTPGSVSSAQPFVLSQHMWGEACKILLHRPYILTPTESVDSISSHAQATKAIDRLIAMTEDSERFGTLREVTRGISYCLFVAGTVLVGNLTSTDTMVATRARSQLHMLTRWLCAIAEKRGSAWGHLVILEKLSSAMDVSLRDTGLEGIAQQARASSGSSTFLDGIAVPHSLLDAQPPSSASIELGDRFKSAAHLATPPHSAALPSPRLLDSRPQTSEQPRSAAFVPQRDESDLSTFWSDMPLGDDLRVWTAFTDALRGVTVEPRPHRPASARLPSSSEHTSKVGPSLPRLPPLVGLPHASAPASRVGQFTQALSSASLPMRSTDWRRDNDEARDSAGYDHTPSL